MTGARPNDAAASLLLDRTLGDYLALVASDAPAPGGGSVAGVVAALGAAVGAMAARLSGERDVDGERRLPPALVGALARLDQSRADATRLAAADERAYAAYRAAAAMPRDDDAQRDARRRAMQDALVEATDIPLALAAACLAILEAMEPVIRLGKPAVRADADLAVLLATAAARGALLNVRGNAGLLRDSAATDDFRAKADAMEGALAGAHRALLAPPG